MEIIFRPMLYEANISSFQSTETLVYEHSLEADTVSVTANPMPGSPLSIIAKRLNLDRVKVHKAAVKCNRYAKIAVLENAHPRIFLIPKTLGYRDVSWLIDGFLESAEMCGSEVINFTHYGLITRCAPEKEVKSIFKRFSEKSSQSDIKVIIWDVDARHVKAFRELHTQNFVTKKS
jgi:hypothetical protein